VLVAINKATSAQTATIALRGGPEADRARVFTLTAGEARPVAGPDLQASPRSTFAYAMPAQSVSVVAPVPVPGTAAAPQPGGTPARPRLSRLLALPSTRRCVRRRLRLRVRRALRPRLASLTLRLGGRRARVIRGRALGRPITLGRLPRGRFRLRITARLKDGTNVSATRRYRRCRRR
jgi:hypothetical protein